MSENGKAFYNVIGMSEKFREFERDAVGVISRGMDPSASQTDKVAFVNTSLKLWELRFQAATAQQLTNISESLKAIHRLWEPKSGNENQS